MIDGKKNVLKYNKNDNLVNKLFGIKNSYFSNLNNKLNNENNNGDNVKNNKLEKNELPQDNPNISISNNYINNINLNLYIVKNINSLDEKFNLNKYELDIDNYNMNSNLKEPDSLSNSENEEKDKSKEKSSQKCNCMKSKCLKLYCECFAAGRYCEGCNCKDCHNDKSFEPERSNIMNKMKNKKDNAFLPKITEDKQHLKGCKCSKSNCRKKYCECFQNKIECSINCRCIGCKNCSEEVNKEKEVFNSRENNVNQIGYNSKNLINTSLKNYNSELKLTNKEISFKKEEEYEDENEEETYKNLNNYNNNHDNSSIKVKEESRLTGVKREKESEISEFEEKNNFFSTDKKIKSEESRSIVYNSAKATKTKNSSISANLFYNQNSAITSASTTIKKEKKKITICKSIRKQLDMV